MIPGLRVGNAARLVPKTTPGCGSKSLRQGLVRRSETARRFASTTSRGFLMEPSSTTRVDGAPIEIFIGSTKIICGFEKALMGMRAGNNVA